MIYIHIGRCGLIRNLGMWCSDFRRVEVKQCGDGAYADSVVVGWCAAICDMVMCCVVILRCGAV